MNAYDEKAIVKGIGTGLGALIGGPIGASIGGFAGDMVGKLFTPETKTVRNNSFTNSVNPMLGYRTDNFGKGYQLGYKTVTEKPTTFSNILNTASDVAPMAMGALGIKGVGFGNMFKKASGFDSMATKGLASVTESALPSMEKIATPNLNSIIADNALLPNIDNNIFSLPKLGEGVENIGDVLSKFNNMNLNEGINKMMTKSYIPKQPKINSEQRGNSPSYFDNTNQFAPYNSLEENNNDLENFGFIKSMYSNPNENITLNKF